MSTPHTIAPTDSAGEPLTRNRHLLAWVDEIAALTKPDRVVWCDGSDEERQRLTEEAIAAGIVERLDQEKLPGCLHPPLQPQRRGARRAAHLHLHAHQGRGRPHQQLDGPRRRVRQAGRALRRLDARAHHVRRPVRHGPGRLAHVQGRRRDHRQRLRRAQHAHHDAHGPRRAAHAGRLQRLEPGPALHPRLQPGAPLHLPLPPGQHHLEHRLGLRRQRAAGQEVPRPAHRQLPRPAGGLARRAHAHPRRGVPRGGDDLRRRRLPQRLRQDQLRHDDPAQALQGVEDSGRWATTSPGCAWARTGASTPSTPRPATSAWPRGRA